jgi:hypothetical protein
MKMSLRRIPVDAAALDLQVVQVVAKTRRNDDGVETQTTNFEGVKQWTVLCLVNQENSKTALLEVNVPSATEPQLEVMSTPRFGDLQAIPWSIENRSGVSFSAATVASVPAHKAGD